MNEPFIKHSSSGFPERKQIHNFRNALIDLKKTLQMSKDPEELETRMEHFINANRAVIWPHHTSAVFHKDEAEKAMDKVVSEFQRYTKDLSHSDAKNSYQDLLDALAIVESMTDRLQEGA